jgi:hypothetical protein
MTKTLTAAAVIAGFTAAATPGFAKTTAPVLDAAALTMPVADHAATATPKEPEIRVAPTCNSCEFFGSLGTDGGAHVY